MFIRADILINTVLAVSVLQAASPAQRYRCELLLQMSHVAWSMCLCLAVQKQLIRSTCHLGCTDSCASREPCVRCGYKYPHGKGATLKGSTYAPVLPAHCEVLRLRVVDVAYVRMSACIRLLRAPCIVRPSLAHATNEFIRCCEGGGVGGDAAFCQITFGETCSTYRSRHV